MQDEKLQTAGEEISLKDIVDFLKGNWKRIALLGMVGLLSAAAYIALIPAPEKNMRQHGKYKWPNSARVIAKSLPRWFSVCARLRHILLRCSGLAGCLKMGNSAIIWAGN